MNKLYLLSLLGIKGAYLNVISENIEKNILSSGSLLLYFNQNFSRNTLLVLT